MNIEQVRASGRKLIIFAGQLIILMLCIWYIEFIYYANIYPDKLVSDTFEQSSCTLLSKALTNHGTMIHSYRADFLVSYTAQGVLYQSETSANGLDRSFTTDRASQEEALAQFETHSVYPCWYNPNSPQTVVLELRHNWSSTFPLFIPSVIALLMTYYIARAIFVFFGIAAIKTREKIKKED